MKTIITNCEAKEGFNDLSPIMQRMFIFNAIDGAWQYHKMWTVISDLDGKGWYMGNYCKTPTLSSSNKVYYRTQCAASGTYKNGKYYNTCLTLRQFMITLSANIPKFEFCNKVMTSPCKIPDHVIKSILDGKITSQEEIWKRIAHISYKDKHWKVYKFCLENYIVPNYIKLVCKDWEAIPQFISKDDNLEQFKRLYRTAIVTGEQISCRWSYSRMLQEEQKLNRLITATKISLKEDKPVYILPEDTNGFTIVNTERQAFEVSDLFHNCVSSYWSHIKSHKYFVVYNDKYCIGYQIIHNGDDLLLDQMRTDYNGPVDSQTQASLDALVRPMLYKLLNQIPRDIPNSLKPLLNY